MPKMTAQSLVESENSPFTITIGDDREVVVKRPDLRLLVLEGILPTPLLASAMQMIGKWIGTDLSVMTEDDQRERGPELLAFYDIWVCAALVEPRAVKTREEMVPGETLFIGDLTVGTKERIILGVQQNDPKRVEREAEAKAAETFSAESAGAEPAQDVQELQPTA